VLVDVMYSTVSGQKHTSLGAAFLASNQPSEEGTTVEMVYSSPLHAPGESVAPNLWELLQTLQWPLKVLPQLAHCTNPPLMFLLPWTHAHMSWCVMTQ